MLEDIEISYSRLVFETLRVPRIDFRSLAAAPEHGGKQLHWRSDCG